MFAPWVYFSILNICDQRATMCCGDQGINKGGTITCLCIWFQKNHTWEGKEINIENETLKSPQRAIFAYSKLLCFSKHLFSWQSQPLPWLHIGTTQQLENKWEDKRNLQIGSHPRDKSGAIQKVVWVGLFSQISGFFKFHAWVGNHEELNIHAHWGVTF